MAQVGVSHDPYGIGFHDESDDRPAKNDSYSFLGENRLNLPT